MYLRNGWARRLAVGPADVGEQLAVEPADLSRPPAVVRVAGGVGDGLGDLRLVAEGAGARLLEALRKVGVALAEQVAGEPAGPVGGDGLVEGRFKQEFRGLLGWDADEPVGVAGLLAGENGAADDEQFD